MSQAAMFECAAASCAHRGIVQDTGKLKNGALVGTRMGLPIDEIVRRRPYNAAADLVDENVACGRGSKVAFIDPERALTYGELQARSCQFARALKTLGIRQESRVALLLLDTVDFPVTFFGAIRGGAVALPLNALLTEAQYAYVLADSRACAIVAQASLAKPIAAIAQRLPELRTVILAGATPADKAAFPTCDLHLLDDILAAENATPLVAATNSDEVAFWMYTSGSTGDPKGVKHVHTTPAAAAALMGRAIIGISENDLVFSAAKLFFSYGMGNAMAFPMSVGGTAILWPHRPTPDAVFNIMRRHNPTVFYGVPTLYASLLAHTDMTTGMGSNRLRLCVSAGEALPSALGERWRATAGCDVIDGIGSTEMFQTFLSNRPGDVRYGSTGKPVPGYDLKLVDEAGQAMADGEIGELVVRGPTAGEGYWNQRDKSRRTFAGEWTHSGDKFYRDADGYYHYCGRTDDMFKVSGMWVSPFEVEAALASHEAVFEAAVIGKQDADGLVKPKAFIVLKDGYTADDRLLENLRVHVKERAGPWKFPRWIDVRTDLPRTATGKIQRFKLRDLDSQHP
jgi:4-hydroxybenzoate-CoA ligase